MYVFDNIAVDVMHINPTISRERLVWWNTIANVMSTVEIPFCNRHCLTSEENEDKYLRGCSHECRVHPPSRYVSENELTQAEVIERLAAIGESWIEVATVWSKQPLGLFSYALSKNLKFVSVSFRKIGYTICKRFQRRPVMAKTFYPK